jgi:hypothetical protein
MMGAAIVEASQDYRHHTEHERRAENTARAKAYCEGLGLHTVEEKRAWLKDAVRKLTKKMDARP